MAKYGKWIGGGLGWALGGPIGAILGVLVGGFFDASGKLNRKNNPAGDFAVSLIILVAAVMKADNKVMKSELNYVKEFFSRSFGYEKSSEAIVMLHDILKKEIPLQDVCQQILTNMRYSERLQLLHLLFGVSNADGQVVDSEVKIIHQISNMINIDEKDFISIKSMFIKDVDSAYKILEVEPNASESEIKKAYRKMAIKYHPDKVAHLGEDFQNTAKEKFQKVNQAYETIKGQRNFA